MTNDTSYAAMAYDAPSTDRNAAVSELFVAQHARLVTLAQMLVGDFATAEDVVQDAFASLYRRWTWLRDKGAAVGYVQTAVVNGARTHLRKRRHLSYVPVDLSPDIETDAADADLLRNETRRALIATLAELPSRQREVVVLRYYLDQSEQEIAATLSISRGSVKKHASRALATLGARLEGQR
ncbi:MAG TPA: SigE family RNA polymerase sigma factor [Mycobacteriales bacterium]|jgi:RNA polymerase sigma-70 factor (sigma-E family)|nr:SigE family RNA polymerase sigma factor [Mycobacteriales bacterium]